MGQVFHAIIGIMRGYVAVSHILVLFINNKSACENVFSPHTSAIFSSVPSRYAAKNEPRLRKKSKFHILDPYL